jgi:RNA polymerase sigma-70 factor, ECF subfamily
MSSASQRITDSSPTSLRLLARIHRGDASALDRLLERYLPRLHAWAHGRLPRWVRTGADTPDLIQDVLLRSARRLPDVELRCRASLAAYFRTAVRNRIRDEHRRSARHPLRSRTRTSNARETSDSPLDRLIGASDFAKYRAALAALDADDRELIVAHVELDYSHQQLGCMTDRTPNAARMALHRAIGRLAARMRDE